MNIVVEELRGEVSAHDWSMEFWSKVDLARRAVPKHEPESVRS